MAEVKGKGMADGKERKGSYGNIEELLKSKKGRIRGRRGGQDF